MSGAAAGAAQKNLAIAALLLGAAAIAFAPIFVRLSDTSPTASAFWRVALATLPLWLWVLAAERKRRGSSAAAAPLPWKALVLADASLKQMLNMRRQLQQNPPRQPRHPCHLLAQRKFLPLQLQLARAECAVNV